MKRILLTLSLIACHGQGNRLDGTASGSAVASPAVTPSTSVTAQPDMQDHPPAAKGAAPSVAPAAQPNRSAADVARLSEAQARLDEAIESAKRAKTLKDACSRLGPLSKALDALQLMAPPAGFERVFNELRGGLVTQLDVIQSQDCADGSGMDEDTVRSGLEGVRKDLIKLQGIGARP